MTFVRAKINCFKQSIFFKIEFKGEGDTIVYFKGSQGSLDLKKVLVWIVPI
jgi:hypothetical protein